MNIQTFDYSVDLLQSLIWQYDEAFSLGTLVKKKQDWYTQNQTQFWTEWYSNVFNLLTANTFGLVVWSMILNVPLFILNEPESPSKPIWGFNAYTPSFPTLENSYKNFGRPGMTLAGTTHGTTSITGISSTASLIVGMLVTGADIPSNTFITVINTGTSITISNAATGSNVGESLVFGYNQGGNFSIRGSVIILTTEQQRFLLRLRYYQLSSRCDVTDVNSFLHYLVSTSNINYTGEIYMLDNLNMTITYVFTVNNFPTNLLTAIQDSDVLPRPAGVKIIYSIL